MNKKKTVVVVVVVVIVVVVVVVAIIEKTVFFLIARPSEGILKTRPPTDELPKRTRVCAGMSLTVEPIKQNKLSERILN